MTGRNIQKDLVLGKLNDHNNVSSSGSGGYDDNVKIKNNGFNSKAIEDGAEELLKNVGVSSRSPASTEMVYTKTYEREKEEGGIKSRVLNEKALNYGSITKEGDHRHTQGLGGGPLLNNGTSSNNEAKFHQTQAIPSSSYHSTSLEYDPRYKSLPTTMNYSPYNSSLSSGGGSGNIQNPQIKRFHAGGASISSSGNYPALSDSGGVPTSPKSVGGSTSDNSDSKRLTLAFLVMVIVGTGNRIFMKLQTYPMYDYPFFLNMLTTFVYVPACFVYIIPMILCGNSITPEQRAFPKYKFAIMGFLDGTSGILGIFSVNYIVNAGSIVLLQQAAIPVSMSISKLFLGASYTVSQYTGAVIVMLGIMVTLQPMLGGAGNDNDGNVDSTILPGGEEPGNQALWYFIQVLSCVPMALSSVYKEKALGVTDIDVIYLNGWVSVFQSLSAVIFAIPSAWAMGMELSSLPSNMLNGCLCVLGKTPDFGTNLVDIMNDDDYGISDPMASSCSMAPFYVSSYLAFNVILNVVLIIVLKYGSANVLFLASTVMLPIGNVVFSLKFMPCHQNMKSTDMLGLFCILLGLFLYRFAQTVMKKMRHRLAGGVTSDEVAAEGTADRAARLATQESVRYIGLNQAEYLEPMVDTWVRKAQFRSFLKSSERVRGDLLLRLGIPPSPVVRLGSGSPYLGSERRLSEPLKKSSLRRQQSR